MVDIVRICSWPVEMVCVEFSRMPAKTQDTHCQVQHYKDMIEVTEYSMIKLPHSWELHLLKV